MSSVFQSLSFVHWTQLHVYSQKLYLIFSLAFSACPYTRPYTLYSPCIILYVNFDLLIFAVPRKPFGTRFCDPALSQSLKHSCANQGSEAQRTTDLLLLRFSSHWPHPLSFNRFAFAAHAALPLFTFCLFPHVQNVRLLLYLCSRFSASAFCPFVPAHS